MTWLAAWNGDQRDEMLHLSIVAASLAVTRDVRYDPPAPSNVGQLAGRRCRRRPGALLWRNERHKERVASASSLLTAAEQFCERPRLSNPVRGRSLTT